MTRNFFNVRRSQFSYSEGSRKKKKNEIISDQKSALAGRSRFRFLFVAVDVYMERKSCFLRAKNALVECFFYL